ncbi:MAG: Putative oxidoreductase, partial [uncultured Frankineae bacterium]
GVARPAAPRRPPGHGPFRAVRRRLPPRGVGRDAARRRGLRRAADLDHEHHARARGGGRRVDATTDGLAQGGVRLRQQDRHPRLRRGRGRLPPAHARVDGQAQGRRRDRSAAERL